jgi:KaiC/GvpD/RAD55 family RecA-like ATPase
MRMELGGTTSGSCDLVPVNSTSRHTALDARTMNHTQSCASRARAERSRTRSPAVSMKLTADRSSIAVTPSARADSLMQRLSRAGISPIMTSEIPDLFHVGRLAEYGISHLSDNVILLQYLRAEPRLLRTVTILKSRASAHEPEIREFDITPGGIVLGDPIVSEQVSR